MAGAVPAPKGDRTMARMSKAFRNAALRGTIGQTALPRIGTKVRFPAELPGLGVTEGYVVRPANQQTNPGVMIVGTEPTGGYLTAVHASKLERI